MFAVVLLGPGIAAADRALRIECGPAVPMR
jgi:hypothetical protein